MLSCRKLDYDFLEKKFSPISKLNLAIFKPNVSIFSFFFFFFFWGGGARQNLVFQMSIFCHARPRSNKINSK